MKLQFFMLLFTVCCAVYGQNNAVVSGGNAIGNSGTCSYSIGQVFYEVLTSTKNDVVPGLQQPFEISVLANKSNDPLLTQVIAYPNPVSRNLILELPPETDKEIYYEIYDTNGRTIGKRLKISNSRTHVLMQDLPPGLYFLRISDQDNADKIFKILKN